MELRSILFLFLELVLTIVFGIYHDVCIYNYLNFSVNYVHKKCLIEMSWLLCNTLCFLCMVRLLSSLFYLYFLW